MEGAAAAAAAGPELPRFPQRGRAADRQRATGVAGKVSGAVCNCSQSRRLTFSGILAAL